MAKKRERKSTSRPKLFPSNRGRAARWILPWAAPGHKADHGERAREGPFNLRLPHPCTASTQRFDASGSGPSVRGPFRRIRFEQATRLPSIIGNRDFLQVSLLLSVPFIYSSRVLSYVQRSEHRSESWPAETPLLAHRLEQIRTLFRRRDAAVIFEIFCQPLRAVFFFAREQPFCWRPPPR